MSEHPHIPNQDPSSETMRVQSLIKLEIVDGGNTGLHAPLETMFSYSREDPMAVTLEFGADAPTPITWIIGRSLIADGIYEPTGEGDVMVWPLLSQTGTAQTVIELFPLEADKNIALAAASRELVAFIDATNLIVPVGQESAHLDVDAALKQFEV